jgi:hypothetical protein
MHKRVITPEPRDSRVDDAGWLDLSRLCQAEITSEDAAHPVESALLGEPGAGWRAARPGEQLIRLLFDEPRRIRRVRLMFREEERERTQEFMLRWSPDGGRSYREMVRQQYTFSPPGTTREVEDYGADLDGVTVFELEIIPDIGGGDALASLEQLRLA